MTAPLGRRTPRPARQDRAPLHAAFAGIYQRFASTVHGIVLARVGHGDAEDVTQEVFLSIYRGLSSLREVEAVGAWICTIARNAATDHLRRRRRGPHAMESPENLVSPQADDGELANRVLQLVRGLPSAYRETLVLRLVEGLTGPEIAERTGLTHGSVRVNLTRGMAMLRKRLRQEGWS